MASKREFDVVLFGATGYTGDHVARALHRLAEDGWPQLRWAIAGRSEAKLKALVAERKLCPTGVIVADVSDRESLSKMAARGTVVMNATGPYRFFGEAVVEACIEAKADYVDLCGEPEFIDRCLLKHSDAAKAAGVIIVHSCAFDSVPADIGCLFTASQFEPPALCAHADMYHTFTVRDVPEAQGASGHATTFFAAVHGFAGAKATRAQRKELMAKLEKDEKGSSQPPVTLGPKLRVAPGPRWKPDLQKYTFLFPGSDVAVVRTSQRHLAHLPQTKGEPYLTPQFGASFCVNSTVLAVATAAFGLLFNVLAQRAWGRKLLLNHPKFFSYGAFSNEGPTEEMLKATSWKTVFFAKGWSQASPESPPNMGFDTAVRTSISGPEPGYIATALMFSVMARALVEDRSSFRVAGGVFTPGGLVGSGGVAAVQKLVQRLRGVGIAIEVEERKTLVPKPLADQTKRPAWQTALNAVAFLGWGGVVVQLLHTWPQLSYHTGSPLSQQVLALEGVCAFEVLQIALGTAKGNLMLGSVLHYTRLLVACVVMPAVPTSLATKLVLLAWGVTEVCRYPMFLAPTSAPARIARYVAPIFTFPVGAGAEAVAAYLSLSELSSASTLLRTMVALVIPTNLFGGLAAYPGLVKKGLDSFRTASPRSTKKD
eukprot:TRINITY_DN71233_c0_g1_i1.p1 TRINITY_DN71233_c0_g1~~TRINITY_DN71233_c0_g1_i1.p1  ORF type:complete len:682 (-),score=72.63 TRINITY_DN71233_c0_g1_i1:166-2127(-)